MKKLIVLSALLMAYYGKGQIVLNSVGNFSDFTVQGLNTAAINSISTSGYLEFESKIFTPSTFTVSKTYSSSIIFDSIVVKCSVLTFTYFGSPVMLNSAIASSGTSTLQLKATNTNSISIPFNISLPDSASKIRFSNLNVTGYANNVGLPLLSDNRKKWFVYPNPVSSQLLLSGVADMRLFDAKGNLRLSHNNVREADLSNLESGIYLLNLSTGQFTQTIKIVKQ